MKKSLKKVWDKLFPYIAGTVILIFCLALKGVGSITSDSQILIKDSLDVNNLNLEKDMMYQLYFKTTNEDILPLLVYFQSKFPKAEIVSLTRDASGNPLTTAGYKVSVKN